MPMNSPKSGKILLSALAALLLPWTLGAQPAGPSAVQVRPVAHLDKDFILGADVSMLKEIELRGGKYYDENGKEGDCLKILKDHGVNWVRLRLWNNPVNPEAVVSGGQVVSKAGDPVGGGSNDLARTVELASRAKKLGLKVLLDLHYSDFWADPSTQTTPAAWKKMTLAELETAVHTFTAEALKKMKAAGALPDMVQVGNEVNGGMLWPVGKTWKQGEETIGGYEAFAALLAQGIKAVREAGPMKIAIHLSNGGDNELYRRVFGELTARKLDFDVIGFSYYPYWHGDLAQLSANLNDMAKTFGKEVAVLETSYGYTFDNGDGQGNIFSPGMDKTGGYKATVQGQASEVRDIVDTVSRVPGGKGLGVFYWAPDWIPVAGAGWRTGEGNAWENQALFDFHGKALASLSVFKQVRDTSAKGGDPVALGSEPATAVAALDGTAWVLPEKVLTTFSDDSIRLAPVTWNPVDQKSFKTAGSTVVLGKVTGTAVEARLQLNIVEHINLVADPSFESGSLGDWKLDGETKAASLEKNPGNAHSGSWSLHYWLDKAFSVTVKKQITGLKNGTYTLKIWAAGGGGERALALTAEGFGTDQVPSTPVKNTGWQKWAQYTIKGIVVTNGQCLIGVQIDGASGSWGNFDDVEFFQE